MSSNWKTVRSGLDGKYYEELGKLSKSLYGMVIDNFQFSYRVLSSRKDPFKKFNNGIAFPLDLNLKDGETLRREDFLLPPGFSVMCKPREFIKNRILYRNLLFDTLKKSVRQVSDLLLLDLYPNIMSFENPDLSVLNGGIEAELARRMNVQSLHKNGYKMNDVISLPLQNLDPSKMEDNWEYSSVWRRNFDDLGYPSNMLRVEGSDVTCSNQMRKEWATIILHAEKFPKEVISRALARYQLECTWHLQKNCLDKDLKGIYIFREFFLKRFWSNTHDGDDLPIDKVLTPDLRLEIASYFFYGFVLSREIIQRLGKSDYHVTIDYILGTSIPSALSLILEEMNLPPEEILEFVCRTVNLVNNCGRDASEGCPLYKKNLLVDLLNLLRFRKDTDWMNNFWIVDGNV